MSTLAQLRTRVLLVLLDTASAIFTADLVDDSLRQVLHSYTLVNPLTNETVIVLPGEGREIALDALTNLRFVLDVWWPYDSLSPYEWPPNRVKGYRLDWDDARPVLNLYQIVGNEPQTDDEVRIWYATPQTIQDLDSASVTTVLAEHESHLVNAAAGQAAMSRSLDLVETAGTDLYQVSILATWGANKLRLFNTWLDSLRQANVRLGPAWGSGWYAFG